MLDITSSCRTCMKENVASVNLYEIVKIDENCLQLAQLLMLCTPIQVSNEDGLPQLICVECSKILRIVYAFRNQAEKAQEEFKKLLLNKIKKEPADFQQDIEPPDFQQDNETADFEQDNEPKTENDHDYFEPFSDFGISGNFFKAEQVEEKKYLCNKCNKSFVKEKKLLKHLQMHDSPFECVVCKKTYINKASLEKHLGKHYKQRTCLVCDQNFETELLLETHMNEHPNCNVQIKIEQEVQQTTAVLQCPDCDLTFTKQRSLSMHQRGHKNKKKEFICDACGKIFSMKHQLKRHVVLHSDIRPYKCTKCPKSYARKDQLKTHVRTHKESKPYVCAYCKKGFTQLCSLKDHNRSHTGETPFLCSQCGKGFSNRSNLRQHMMRHTGLKPYACNMCPKTFCTKGQMTSHMTTHTGEHPYKCEECGATFTKPSSLKKHSLIHLGIRPFACDTCKMRFTCKDHLKRHYRIHTGEKPYRCNYCDRAFSQSNDLIKHTRAHIGQNTYECTICGSRFRLMSELKSHYPIHFVDGKTQLSDTQNEPIINLKPSPTTDLELMLKQNSKQEPPLLYENKDIPVISLKPIVDKDLPILTLKPSPAFEQMSDLRVHDDKNRYTITINSCDKNGLVNGITINLPTKES